MDQLAGNNHNGVALLTFREMEILSQLAEGKTSKEIAEHFSLSKHTVDTHRRKMLKKAGCKNTVELLSKSSQLGLISPL